MFWNKYPQTNFHELNADWIISKIKELTDTVEEYTALVDAMDTRVTALESGQASLGSRMTAAETNIGTLTSGLAATNSTVAGHTAAIASLQNAAIQDARMIRSIDEADRDAASAVFNYTVDQYTDGVKSTETEQFTMYGATESLAGCLEAADKVKLNKMTADGNDITFAGKVKSSSAPAAGSDLTNKTYVDSLAISGSATIGTESNALSSPLTVNTTDVPGGTIAAGYAEAQTYGEVKEMHVFVRLTVPGMLNTNNILCYGTFKSGLRPKRGYRYYCSAYYELNGSYTYVPCVLSVGESGSFSIYYAGPATGQIAQRTYVIEFVFTFL